MDYFLIFIDINVLCFLNYKRFVSKGKNLNVCFHMYDTVLILESRDRKMFLQILLLLIYNFIYLEALICKFYSVKN